MLKSMKRGGIPSPLAPKSSRKRAGREPEESRKRAGREPEESRTLRADPLTGLKGEGGSRLAPFGLTVGEPRAGDKLEIGKVKLENGEKIPHPREPRVGSSGIWCEAPAHGDVLGGYPTTAIAGLFPPFTVQLEATTPRQLLSVQN